MSIIELLKDVSFQTGAKTGKDILFLFGDTAYINSILKIYAQSPHTSKLKFPFIFLHTPFDEVRGEDKNITTSSNVAITIATSTLSRYTNEERLEQSFIKELRPLYDTFMESLSAHPMIDKPYNEQFRHIYRERYDLGARGAMDSNNKKLDDLIDAIELENLSIKIKKQNCYGKYI